MKKLFLSLVLVLSSLVMFAQSNMREVVYLKNGSVIKGAILELVPNENIKIQTADGSIFVYPMADVERITNETVEEPQTQQSTTFKMEEIMERDGRNLLLAGRKLSDKDLKSLLSEDGYETYMSAKNQYVNGNGYLVAGCFCFGASITLSALAFIIRDEHFLQSGIIFAIPAAVSLPVGFIYHGIGKGRMNWVADEYNRTQSKNYSFNMSPSIMKCNAPGATSNMALGMTFSLNF